MLKRRVQSLWIMFFKRVQFCESWWKKGSILRVKFKKGQSFLSDIVEKKKSQFLGPNWKKVPSPESQKNKNILGSDNLQKGSILWVILWRGFNSLSPLVKRIQFFESNFWKSGSIFKSHSKRVQFCESCSKRMFNSVDQKSVQLSLPKKKNGFDSLPHEKEEGSILLSDKKRVQFFESYWKKLNTLTQNWKNQSIESYSRQSSSLWVILRKSGSILWVVFRMFNSFNRVQKVFDSVNHMRKTILWVILINQKSSIFESYSKNGSIIRVNVNKTITF